MYVFLLTSGNITILDYCRAIERIKLRYPIRLDNCNTFVLLVEE